MIAGGFAVLAVVLRIFARLPCFGGTWGWDDWAIVVAMVIYAAYTLVPCWAKADIQPSFLCCLLLVYRLSVSIARI